MKKRVKINEISKKFLNSRTNYNKNQTLSPKAQQSIGLSFGMIFSIILIIFFLLIAFITIRGFLGTKDCAQIGLFIGDFDEEVTNIWNSQDVSTNFRRSLPTKLEYVCFADLSKNQKGKFKEEYDGISYYKGNIATLFFYPKNAACKIPFKNIEHLDIPKIISSNNPYCIPVKNGVINIKLEKEFNQRLVSVS